MPSLGQSRVLEPPGVLPQAAYRLDASPEIADDEVRVSVERLNLDAASFRQLREAHGHDGAAVRSAVLRIVGERGKMHNPVTGSGGMLIGTVDEVGPESPLGLRKGDRIATLVSLTLTPLAITDGLARWDGESEQVPCDGHAILFGRSVAAKLPDDLPPELALAVFDVCGAPALTAKVVRERRAAGGSSTKSSPIASTESSPGSSTKLSPGLSPIASPESPPGSSTESSTVSSSGSSPIVSPRLSTKSSAKQTVCVLGGAGKSGSLALAAARRSGASRLIGLVPTEKEATTLEAAALADVVVVADARDPVAVAEAVRRAGGPADLTVVCVDVGGCEGGAILATAPGGTVVFFSMATSFSAAALGAEGVGADVTMLIGNGYLPGHAEYALDLLRTEPGVRKLFEARIQE